MVLRRFGRSRRGLSTVISTILMIMVVMIGMSILFGFVVYYSQTYQAGVGGSVLEYLTVEDIWMEYGDDTVKITVYNPGTQENLGTDVNFEVTTIFVNNAPLINCKGDSSSNPNFDSIYFNEKEQLVRAGESVTFEGKWSENFDPDRAYTFKFVTMRGSIIEVQSP